MFSANGTVYNEEHSISFGKRVKKTIDGVTRYVFVPDANTWEDWHLIPVSRPFIAHPEVVTRYVDIPGANSMADLTNYLTGSPQYKMRVGSIQFLIDNYHESPETIREHMVAALHGKTTLMVLLDDPTYVYEGRFSVGNLESGQSHSSISINYQLEPFKLKIDFEGYGDIIWDTFNFETDYDYSYLSNIRVSGDEKIYYIYASGYTFKPVAEYISGNSSVTVTFGDVTKTVTKTSGNQTLGSAKDGKNKLVISGTGTIRVRFRGGSL